MAKGREVTPSLAEGIVPVLRLLAFKAVKAVPTPEAIVPSAGVTRAGEFDNTVLPVPVDDVTPVPPLATASVPASVIAPLVADEGVRPVVPALKVVTMLDGL